MLTAGKDRIAVVYGGNNAERRVSLRSGETVSDQLLGLGFEVEAILVGENPVRSVLECRADGVIIMLHGGWGEDGRLQAFLELLGLPYSGSRPLSCAVAMNKVFAKNLFIAAGVPTPAWSVLRDMEELKGVATTLPLPWVVKPVSQGSSVGIALVEHLDDTTIVSSLLEQYDELLLESFVSGKILTVPVIDVPGESRPLGPLEIVPQRSKLYDAEAKYYGLKDYILQPELSPSALQAASDVAFQAHQALGCSGVTRVDLIYSLYAGPFVLEVNTIPGMGSGGNIITACESQGISRQSLVGYLVASVK